MHFLAQPHEEKFLKKLIGENEIEAVLQKLDRLAQGESRTTAVQSLQGIYSLFKNMRVIMDGMQTPHVLSLTC
jgi:hypothetical protein